MAHDDLVLAFTGASGAPYGLRLLEVLLRAGRGVHLVISPAAAQVLTAEVGRTVDLQHFRLHDLVGGVELPDERLTYHHHRNFQASISSGSFRTGGMIICPCSMGTIAAVAHGFTENLIHRAASVHLKEHRPLVLMPRETPLSLVQLRNLTLCAEAGAVVMPAMPAFYTRPQTLDDMVDFMVARVCDHLQVPHTLSRRWGPEE